MCNTASAVGAKFHNEIFLILTPFVAILACFWLLPKTFSISFLNWQQQKIGGAESP